MSWISTDLCITALKSNFHKKCKIVWQSTYRVTLATRGLMGTYFNCRGTPFLSEFKQLHTLPFFFPNVPCIGLSGTLTKELKITVEKYPDKPNIYLKKVRKISSLDFRTIFENIYIAECNRLKKEGIHFPVTLLYIPLTYMGDAADYLRDIFGPMNIYCSPYSLLCGNQDKSVIDATIKDLRSENPRIRLILTTSVSGMGFDSPCITRVVYACPPRDLAQYFQEIGQAGRRGQPSEAILYFNSHDIAKNLPGIQENIVHYCLNDNKCLREILGLTKLMLQKDAAVYVLVNFKHAWPGWKFQ